jgi:hypothetical protein
MAILVGVFLAVLVTLFARWVGLDRDRAFYPTVLVVVASYYDLFAVMGGSVHALYAELAATVVFVGAVIAGFRWNLWIVAAGLAGHGLFDLVHGRLIVDPGVPPWWPAFCLAYDVTAALGVAWLLQRGQLRARPKG